MFEKLVLGFASSVVGSVIGYGAFALKIEGRVDAMERTLSRIELRLFPPADKP